MFLAFAIGILLKAWGVFREWRENRLKLNAMKSENEKNIQLDRNAFFLRFPSVCIAGLAYRIVKLLMLLCSYFTSIVLFIFTIIMSNFHPSAYWYILTGFSLSLGAFCLILSMKTFSKSWVDVNMIWHLAASGGNGLKKLNDPSEFQNDDDHKK